MCPSVSLWEWPHHLLYSSWWRVWAHVISPQHSREYCWSQLNTLMVCTKINCLVVTETDQKSPADHQIPPYSLFIFRHFQFLRAFLTLQKMYDIADIVHTGHTNSQQLLVWPKAPHQISYSFNTPRKILMAFQWISLFLWIPGIEAVVLVTANENPNK